MKTMTRMQGPTVVGTDEGPLLLWQPQGHRVPLDVADGPADFLRVIQEDFPATAARPGRVIRRPVARAAEPCPAGVFERLHHLFRRMLVLADQYVNVVRHD